jgi:hypothetical protein
MWRLRHPPPRLLVGSIALCAVATVTTSLVVLAAALDPAQDDVASVDLVPREARGFDCAQVSFAGAPEVIDPFGGKLRVACFRDDRGDSWAVTQASGLDGALGSADDRCWYTSSPPCTGEPVVGAPELLRTF